MKMKKLLIITLSALALGFVLIIAGIALGGLSYIKVADIDGIPIVVNTDSSEDDNGDAFKGELDNFNKIDIECDNLNLEIEKTDKEIAYFKSDISDKNEFSYSVNDDELKIIQSSSGINFGKKRRYFININFLKNILLGRGINDGEYYTLNLYLPEKVYENIVIDNSAGYLNMSDVAANEANIKLDLGEIQIENISFKNVKVKNNMGRTQLENFYSSDKANVENDMGEIVIESGEFSELILDSNMGNVEFENISVEKSLTIDCDMGNVEGDIKLDKTKQYQVKVDSSLGNVEIDDRFYNVNVDATSDVEVEIDCDMGNVEIRAK